MERDHLKDLCVNGRIILKRIFNKCDGTWSGLIWFMIGRSEGSCIQGNGIPVCTKCRELLD